MITAVPQWPYLVEIDGVISLQAPNGAGAGSPLGDCCGEWGSHLDEKRQPVGVRLMYLSDDFSRESSFVRAKNAGQADGDLIVFFRDHRLPDIESMPFLPVYRAARSDGREILQLSGYEWD
jgi:hypothetical protein